MNHEAGIFFTGADGTGDNIVAARDNAHDDGVGRVSFADAQVCVLDRDAFGMTDDGRHLMSAP